MKYKLMTTGKGIIVTRKPKFYLGDIEFIFEGAPPGSTVIFKDSEKKEFYRLMEDGVAVLDGKKIKGTTAVTVISKDRKRVWNCESFNADAHFDGVLIMPDDADLQAEIAQLKIEEEEMRACMASFTKGLDELKEKYEKLTEGYDFT